MSKIQLVYLFLYTTPNCKTDASLLVPGSTCHHLQGQDCYNPSWTAGPLHHTYGNTDHRYPTDPTGRLPAETLHNTQIEFDKMTDIACPYSMLCSEGWFSNQTSPKLDHQH